MYAEIFFDIYDGETSVGITTTIQGPGAENILSYVEGTFLDIGMGNVHGIQVSIYGCGIVNGFPLYSVIMWEWVNENI
jgi:hypothetical protein